MGFIHTSTSTAKQCYPSAVLAMDSNAFINTYTADVGTLHTFVEATEVAGTEQSKILVDTTAHINAGTLGEGAYFTATSYSGNDCELISGSTCDDSTIFDTIY